MAVHLGAERQVLVTRGSVAWQRLASRPDFCVGAHLLLVVLLDRLADLTLEEEGTLLHGRVHLAIDENTGTEVSLRVDAEILVLRHDALVHVVDELEVFVIGILVSEYFVLHGRGSRSNRHKTLSEEEVWSESNR